jgi:hypothetical protein
MDGTGLGSCPVAGFVKTLESTTTVLGYSRLEGFGGLRM